jgi:hypothetical protein
MRSYIPSQVIFKPRPFPRNFVPKNPIRKNNSHINNNKKTNYSTIITTTLFMVSESLPFINNDGNGILHSLYI